jgi:BirA family transcriptional regulator, biotin operon repressor / biotin---[acetyl-CoA-carboxylase] ligase
MLEHQYDTLGWQLYCHPWNGGTCEVAVQLPPQPDRRIETDGGYMTIDAVRVMRETTIARVEHHPALDSTNDRAAQCAAQGAIELPALIVADEQTAGRGRGANRWWSSSGSLTFSLLIDAATVAADESRSPLVALAAAVAVVDSVAPLLPAHQVGIRWPNDVHVRFIRHQGETDDRKLAGILVEVLPDRRHVIGIGLNVNNTLADAPAELRDTAATLRDLSGHEHDGTTVLIDLLRRLESAFSQLRGNSKELAARADSLCLQRGQTLTLNWTDRKVTGICRGIAADGGIRLETPGGIQSFLSGSVER